MNRFPRGYRGIGHETIGSDILSVLQVVAFPERVLGAELHAQVKATKPNEWYPIDNLLRVIECVDRVVGRAGLMQMGRKLFHLSHEERARQTLHSAGDLLFSLDQIYHSANRGEGVGGWKVLQFRPGFARLEKTTPQDCAMSEGIVLEAMRMLGVPPNVKQLECVKTGADVCLFEISSVVTDSKWMGTHREVG